ncbi:MFS transporter [Parelusimicrobium proximum]|uniref:MFS transporter n=1 Tax=Parelusimicrobium proximum TaxID=3228953 RepID=UPI003D17BA27
MNKTNPWFYVPSLYFIEGLPYIIINVVSVTIYTKMGIPNDKMAFWTGMLYLPWILKMFWAPLVDNISTKRTWLISMQILLAAIFVITGLSLNLNSFFSMSLLGFGTGAFISATYDIATDGYYMLALSKEEQAFFVGIRTTFYRIAMIFAGGILVMFAGRVEKITGNITVSWMWTLILCGVIFAVVAAYHMFILPRPEAGGAPAEQTEEQGLTARNFTKAFKEYFTQENIVVIILFILLYRVGEATLEKMITPFFLRGPETGALGISTETYGFIRGTVSMIGLIIGNILGGVFLSKFGFRKCIWLFVLLLGLPNVFYVIMSVADLNIYWLAAFLTADQFCYGIGFMAFTIFVMGVSKGKYKTSHYAISTGIMALGMMLPGMYSGKLQMALGYTNFFILTVILSIPIFFVLPFVLKMKEFK